MDNKELAKEMGWTYECQICGEIMKELNSNHLKAHNISFDEYKKKYESPQVKIKNEKTNYKEFFTTDNKSGWKCIPQKLQRNCPNIYNLIMDFIRVNPHLKELPFKQQCWHFINNDVELKKCKICGGEVRYRNINLGYQEHCGIKCINNDPDKYEKARQTNLQRYGNETTFKNAEIRQKGEDKIMERYGVKNVFQSEEIKNSIRKINMETCGVEFNSQKQDARNNYKNTCQEKWGVDSHLSAQEIKDKRKVTNNEKFGVDNVFELEEFQLKARETIMQKYGVDNITKWDEFKRQYPSKSSKAEIDACLRLNAESKFILKGKEFDIKLENDIIEVDGDFYHPDKLINLTLTQINSAINDKEKIDIINNSDGQYKLYKIKTSILKEYNNDNKDIDINYIRENSYIPDYSIGYEQKIITKEYFRKYIDAHGKDKLMQYVPMLLKFIRTFNPEFPYPNEDIYNLNKITDYINTFDFNRAIDDEGFKNNTSATGNIYLKSIFKSFWKSSFKGNLSPIETWNNDNDMLNIIAYRIGINDSDEIFDFSLRNLIRGMSAVRRTVSFFKPVLAASIYKHYLNPYILNPIVFDPCCGFGGRLLGFKSLYSNGRYIGCEPNINTYNELIELGNNFKNIDIHNCKLEEFDNNNNIDYDLAFTSIPYFDLEDYKNNVSYNNYNEWKDIFIGSLLKCRKLIVNMSYELCSELNLTNYIDNYIVSHPTHFNKSNKDHKKEVLLKINF